jgi:hypothetical protein
MTRKDRPAVVVAILTTKPKKEFEQADDLRTDVSRSRLALRPRARTQ